MNDTQKKDFHKMMNIVMETYHKEKMTREMLVLWWSKVSRFEFDIVRKAFDSWLDSQSYPPMPADITALCSGYTQRIAQDQARLPSPPRNPLKDQQRADELKALMAGFGKQKRDYRAWAKKILANPKNHHDLAVRMATEAIHAPQVRT